jgi:uncharacterized protein
VKHPVIHFEIGGRDVARSAKFFEDLFGWQSRGGTLDTGTTEGIRGHLTALGHEPHNYVTVYVEVEDVNVALARAEELGGKRLIGPLEIPTGWFAWFQDLDGNTIGLLRRRRARAFTVRHDAASLLAELPVFDQARLMRVTAADCPPPGSAVELSLEIGELPPIKLIGEVKEPVDGGFYARVDLGHEERAAFEDALRWATGAHREVRFPTVFPVSLKDDDPAVARYVRNLSRKGAFIRTQKSPPVGSLITVQLRLPDGLAPVDVEARVMRAVSGEQAAQSGGAQGVGVKFEALSPEVQTRLDALITSIESRSGKLAIVADDDALIRKMVADLLEAQGIRVVQAATGDEVLAAIANNPERLVLIVMDLTMPGRDGLELVSEISGQLKPRPKPVPIVVLTGGGPSAALQAINRGAKHAILKGATADDILVAIETAMTSA